MRAVVLAFFVSQAACSLLFGSDGATDAGAVDAAADLDGDVQIDAASGTCASDDGCSDEQICDVRAGQCISDAEVVFVQAVSGDGEGCGARTDPCPTLELGLARAQELTLETIHLAGLVDGNVTISGGPFRILGFGAEIRSKAGDMTPTIGVSPDTQVTLEGVTISGQNEAGDGLRMLVPGIGGPSELTLFRVTVNDHLGAALRAEDTSAPLDRRLVVESSKFTNNAVAETMVVVTNVPFSIRNSEISRGGGRSFFFGVNMLPAPVVFEFNTVMENVDSMRCGQRMPGVVPQFVGNILDQQPTGCDNLFAGSWLGVPGAPDNFDEAPLFLDAGNGDYRQNGVSPLLDKLVGPALLGDVDPTGVPRPQNGLYDVGAYERPE